MNKDWYIGMPIDFGEPEIDMVSIAREDKSKVDMEHMTQRESKMQTMVVGMTYVPWQSWKTPYDYSKGLSCGTIFADLNYPFKGRTVLG